ncbi:hypothetical protein HDV01_002396 [Terramyces sp. JEL0728]|nr:hypothetical protein HDV01_002396 [Terramyces sp. JEL0728]
MTVENDIDPTGIEYLTINGPNSEYSNDLESTGIELSQEQTIRVFVQDQMDMQLVPKECRIKRSNQELLVNDYFLFTDELQPGDELIGFEGYIEKYPFVCHYQNQPGTVIVKTQKPLLLNHVYEIKGTVSDGAISPRSHKLLDLDYTRLRDVLFKLGKQGELFYYSLFTDLSLKIKTDNKDFFKQLPFAFHELSIEQLNKKNLQPKREEILEYTVLQHKQVIFDDLITEGKLNEIGYKNIKLIERVLQDSVVDYDIPFTEFQQPIKSIILSDSKLFKTHLEIELNPTDSPAIDLYSDIKDETNVKINEKEIQNEFIEMQKEKRSNGLVVDDGSLFQMQLKIAEAIARDQGSALDLNVFKQAVSLINL